MNCCCLRRTGRVDSFLQIEGEVARRLKSLLRILLQAATDNCQQWRWQSKARLCEVARLVAENRRQCLSGGRTLERALAAEHLVQDASQSEDVSARINRSAADLLGSHVADGANGHSWLTRRLDFA